MLVLAAAKEKNKQARSNRRRTARIVYDNYYYEAHLACHVLTCSSCSSRMNDSATKTAYPGRLGAKGRRTYPSGTLRRHRTSSRSR
ncbi:hypothetical protein Trydic_g20317 [Trypoxylus dichotomus]